MTTNSTINNESAVNMVGLLATLALAHGGTDEAKIEQQSNVSNTKDDITRVIRLAGKGFTPLSMPQPRSDVLKPAESPDGISDRRMKNPTELRPGESLGFGRFSDGTYGANPYYVTQSLASLNVSSEATVQDLIDYIAQLEAEADYDNSISDQAALFAAFKNKKHVPSNFKFGHHTQPFGQKNAAKTASGFGQRGEMAHFAAEDALVLGQSPEDLAATVGDQQSKGRTFDMLAAPPGRQGKSLNLVADILILFRCITFFCQADVRHAEYCCAYSQNIHCCNLVRTHFWLDSHPFHHPPPHGSPPPPHHHHHHPPSHGLPDRAPEHPHIPPSLPEPITPDHYLPPRPSLPSGQGPPPPPYPEWDLPNDPAWGSGPPLDQDLFDFDLGRPPYDDSKTKPGRCPHDDFEWDFQRPEDRIPKVPGAHVSFSEGHYRSCSYDYDCLGSQKCCHLRLSDKEFVMTCRFPVGRGPGRRPVYLS